jgi:hypothetical protein
MVEEKTMRLIACLAVALAASPAFADSGPGGEALHRLGADRLQLRFEGETAARTWPIYVTATEAGARARIHLGFTNAISVMPEVSSLSISVNDVDIAQTPIAAATDPGALDVELPRGLLTPGFNSLRIAVSQRHRVDCSMEATYELWTQLDPATSGLAFPGVADPHIEQLDDLAAISPDPSGVTTIRVVLPEDADAPAVDNAMRAVEAVAIRMGAQRPQVEIVDKVEERPGLYLVAGQRDFLSRHGLANYAGGAGKTLGLEGQEAMGRVVVVAVGDTQKEVAEAIDGVLPARAVADRAESPPAARALASQFGYPVRGALRVPLSELGVRTEEFTGRLFRSSFDITLPGDFYPADYDKLTLSLTAGYASGLLPTSQILVRVNDHEAGSAPLKNPNGAVFHDRPVSVPLGSLRPGVNHVIVEAQTPDGGDAACDVKHVMDARKRFVLFDSSELVIPPLARVGRMPNLAATLSSAFPYLGDDGVVYLPGHDRRTLAAAGSFLARVAVAAQHPVGARLTFDREAVKLSPTLAIGALDDFPPDMIEQVGVDLASLKKLWWRPNATETGVEPSRLQPLVGSGDVFDQWAQGAHASTEALTPHVSVRAIYDRYINIHQEDFAILRAPDRPIEAPENSTILLAQARGAKGSDTWTFVIGATQPALQRDMSNLVAPSNWNEIEGRSAAYSPRSGAHKLDDATRAWFIPTDSLTPANLRLIAAGYLTANLDVYAAIMMVAAVLLGLATRAAVKAHGAKT